MNLKWCNEKRVECGLENWTKIRSRAESRGAPRRKKDWLRFYGELGFLHSESTGRIAPVFASVDGILAQLFFNAQQLVVLGEALGAARGARFDLASLLARSN